jgi:hypothetical protein
MMTARTGQVIKQIVNGPDIEKRAREDRAQPEVLSADYMNKSDE